MEPVLFEQESNLIYRRNHQFNKPKTKFTIKSFNLYIYLNVSIYNRNTQNLDKCYLPDNFVI